MFVVVALLEGVRVELKDSFVILKKKKGCIYSLQSAASISSSKKIHLATALY